MSTPVTVANFNLHAGMDGWGRPFDVVGACGAIDADVLVLEEVWCTDAGAQESAGPTTAPGASIPADHVVAPGVSQARAVAEAYGYDLVEYEMARGRRARPHESADHRWKAGFDWRSQAHALYLDSEVPFSRAITASARYQEAEPGSFGLAVLSRLPIADRRVIDLGRLRRDRARRAAIVLRLDVGGQPLAVVGTHMSHLTYGSITHFRQLRRRLEGEVGADPAALVGDMNLWGPPLSALFPGWVRAVRGRSWPAWRPHSQVDHVLVRGPLLVEHGQVLADAGSDHRPVVARLALTGLRPPAG